MIQRVDALDYLRGLMAVAIMLYHFGSWKVMQVPGALAPLLNLLGLYGVSIFYVLSGAALSLIYFDRYRDSGWILSYAAKRFLRIAPLLWVATGLTIYMGAGQDLSKMFLNFSLLFGFFAHDQYIATGAWSIGNEVVFYAVFPAIIIMTRVRFGLSFALLLSVVVSAYFAIFALKTESTVASQWSTYINPLNQIHLFVGGIVVGRLIIRWRSDVSSIGYVGAISSAIGICVIAYNFQGSALITDWVRYVLSALCITLCLSVGLITLNNRNYIARVLGFLGTTSYSIYLLHPIILRKAKELGLQSSLGDWQAPVLILVVLLLSYFSYVVIEKPAMKLGRLLQARSTREVAPASTAP